MALSVDENNKKLMTRGDLCIGEFRTLAYGATEKPVKAWRRLMPHHNTAAVVTDAAHQLNITSVRSTILSLKDWYLEILSAGYQQKQRIVAYAGGIVTLAGPLKFYEGLKGLSGIEYVVYPILDFPLSIHHISSSDNNNLEIGFTTEDVYAPTTVVKYAEIRRDFSVTLPTRQVQKVFYRYTGTRSNADNATIRMSWGEHSVQRS